MGESLLEIIKNRFTAPINNKKQHTESFNKKTYSPNKTVLTEISSLEGETSISNELRASNNKFKVFISVVIPFNKGKKYLAECLESLTYQKIEEYEVILIINGSNEDISDIINNYQQRLTLKIKHFKGEIGVSKARNEGIKISSGKYVYFLDSDDYLYKNSLDKLVDIAKHNDADIVTGRKIDTYYNLARCYDTYSQKKFEYDVGNNKISDKNASITSIVPIKGDILNISALHVLIKKSVLNNEIFFDESLTYYSDLPFISHVIKNSKTFKNTDDSIYAKRSRDDPIHLPSLDQDNSENKLIDLIKAYIKSLNFMDHDEALRIRFDKKMIDYYIWTFSSESFKRSNDFTHENFKELAGISSNFHPKAIKWYHKPEIWSLQHNNFKRASRYLKLRLGVLKLKSLIVHPTTIKTTVYYNIFNKLKIEENMIIFESFRGQYYNDSPRYIYENLYNNYHDDYRFIWVINDKSKKITGNPKKIKRFSLSYFYYMARSKYWVINLRQPGVLSKRKEQIILSTWHGTPLKKLGLDIDEIYSATPLVKMHYVRDASEWNYLISANNYSTEILRRAFKYTGEVLEYGYPRNDILYQKDNARSLEIKTDLGIPLDKKIILYAPTWRDDEYYGVGQYKFDLKLELDKLQKELSEDYVVLVRTHYFIADNLDLSRYNKFALNVSYHDEIAELYLISDILITDYSSVFFDFANLKRPILFYAYDYEKYASILRGFYIDMEKEIPGPLLFTTEDVIDSIKNIDKVSEEYKEKYEEFYERFCYLDDGNSSKRISEKVFRKQV
jgi:CDP-glycerol glycerophosphotransferase